MMINYESKLERIEEKYKVVVAAESEVKEQLGELTNKKNQEKVKKSWKDNQICEVDKKFSSLMKVKYQKQKELEVIQQELRDLQKYKERIVKESNMKVMLT
jgi:NhaP-type Na+/H+ and K+/H+ antiporter